MTEQELQDRRIREINESRRRAGQRATGMNAGVRDADEEREIERRYEAARERVRGER